MNCHELNLPAVEELPDGVVPAASWGEKEEARQIALLDAVVRLDKIHRVVDEIAASEESGQSHLTPHSITSDIDEALRNSYLDYAMSVIVGGAQDPDIAAGTLRIISRNGTVVGYTDDPRLTLRAIQKQLLTAALAIVRLKQAAKNAKLSALLLTLINAAKSATCMHPLFAYGPELSEYRHRLR